jgi:hypothetical protein
MTCSTQSCAPVTTYAQPLAKDDMLIRRDGSLRDIAFSLRALGPHHVVLADAGSQEAKSCGRLSCGFPGTQDRGRDVRE